MVYSKRLDLVSCAIQQDLIAYPKLFACTNPKLLVYPTPSPHPLGNYQSVFYVC